MKRLLLLSFVILCAVVSRAQTFTTYKEATAAVEDGYKMPSGWTIKKGDKIKIGRGTMPDKSFAFIYKSMTLDLLNNYNAKKEPIESRYANQEGVVKKFQAIGNKKTGYVIRVVIGLGVLTNYWVEIDNAVESGEIIPPAEFAKKSNVADTATPAASIADELKKLKDLLDTGALTQDEYNAQKKKLLGQ